MISVLFNLSTEKARYTGRSWGSGGTGLKGPLHMPRFPEDAGFPVKLQGLFMFWACVGACVRPPAAHSEPAHAPRLSRGSWNSGLGQLSHRGPGTSLLLDPM